MFLHLLCSFLRRGETSRVEAVVTHAYMRRRPSQRIPRCEHSLLGVVKSRGHQAHCDGRGDLIFIVLIGSYRNRCKPSLGSRSGGWQPPEREPSEVGYDVVLDMMCSGGCHRHIISNLELDMKWFCQGDCSTRVPAGDTRYLIGLGPWGHHTARPMRMTGTFEAERPYTILEHKLSQARWAKLSC